MFLKQLFGKLPNGSDVYKYTIYNEMLSVSVIDYGATITDIIFKRKDGTKTNLILGFNSLEDYYNNNSYIGATIGRYSNRIANASFSLNGVDYQLSKNENNNQLHGGKCGFNKKLWKASVTENTIEMAYLSPDGEEGYPGNVSVKACFILDNDKLKIEYHAISDKDTVFGMTNHCYFNFFEKGSAINHLLQINADGFLPVNDEMIPLGIVEPVNKAFDFRTEKLIGKDIDDNDEEIKKAHGYDHCYILNGSGIREAAKASGNDITMTIKTNQPCLQFYSCNMLNEKNGRYGDLLSREAFCLEPQYAPDAINNKIGPMPILKANEEYYFLTEYKFTEN